MEPLTTERLAQLRVVAERVARALTDAELADEIVLVTLSAEVLQAEADRRRSEAGAG
jgi:hypothetical protein